MLNNFCITVGTDKYGEFNHCCMYNDLWINGPKEAIEDPDYTYEKHFGKLLPSFAPRAAIRDYIEGKVIQINRAAFPVNWVVYLSTG